MRAVELLKHISVLGVRLDTDGVKLLIDAPAGAVTLELKEMLTAQKPELIRLLSDKSDNEILPIFSKILNEVVYFVGHNDRARAKHLYTGATYFLDELAVIVAANPTPEELRLIHAGKRKFSGTLSA